MKKTARMMALALAMGICLTSMPLAIAEEEEIVVIEETQEVSQIEEIKETTQEVVKAEKKAKNKKSNKKAKSKKKNEVAEEETEVSEAEEEPVELIVEIEDTETPLGLFDQQAPFTGTVQVQRKGEGTLYYGDEVTLTADVRDANALYQLRWEVNRQDEEGWKPIEGESEVDYDFVLTRDNANYEYRVVLVTEA